MTTFSEFIKSNEGKLYRDLIKHHYTKQTNEQINFSMFGTAEMISEDFMKDIEQIMEWTESQFIHTTPLVDNKIYDRYTVAEAADTILQAFIYYSKSTYNYKLPKNIKKIKDFYSSTKNEELAWNLFQVVTLNLAWKCSKHKSIRKIFGLRKGLFG